ncbi:hypothetical protein F4778DRAFT_785783 [Xylariomycetidae sp. FL2044]|nr:hypothetical protein F4778DRAFT_785783 [Xylariomycetidae sp. FL2044]
MEPLTKRAFPNWTQTPIPGFQLSPAGLIALADLGTISNRTKIVGGASWLDSLLLAPGIHYQQAADALDESSAGSYSAVELVEGKTSTYNITNQATLDYLQRMARTGRSVTVDVGMLPESSYFYPRGGAGGRRQGPGVPQRRSILKEDGADLGWVSHVLYLASPVLTVAAFVFMILLREWWGVASLLALMFSRALNIWVIKQRSSPAKDLAPPYSPHSPSSPPSDRDHQDRDRLSSTLTEYLVDLGHGRSVCLRGLASDLQAITTTKWLRARTHLDGYLEAAAKLTVYLVAAFSGNMTQAGGIVFMALLIVTAGLLGLSNAHARTLRMHGRLAAPTTEHLPHPGHPGRLPDNDDGGGGGGGTGRGTRRRTAIRRTAAAEAPDGPVVPYPDSRQNTMSWPMNGGGGRGGGGGGSSNEEGEEEDATSSASFSGAMDESLAEQGLKGKGYDDGVDGDYDYDYGDRDGGRGYGHAGTRRHAPTTHTAIEHGGGRTVAALGDRDRYTMPASGEAHGGYGE